jgi:hypothetical protein
MSEFVYVPYPMMKWITCIKKWARAEKSLEPGPLYIFYGPQSFEKLYGSNVNFKKNCSYSYCGKFIAFRFKNYVLKYSVKLINAKRWKIQWNISLFCNEWFHTLFLCGRELIFVSSFLYANRSVFRQIDWNVLLKICNPCHMFKPSIYILDLNHQLCPDFSSIETTVRHASLQWSSRFWACRIRVASWRPSPDTDSMPMCVQMYTISM